MKGLIKIIILIINLGVLIFIVQVSNVNAFWSSILRKDDSIIHLEIPTGYFDFEKDSPDIVINRLEYQIRQILKERQIDEAIHNNIIAPIMNGVNSLENAFRNLLNADYPLSHVNKMQLMNDLANVILSIFNSRLFNPINNTINISDVLVNLWPSMENTIPPYSLLNGDFLIYFSRVTNNSNTTYELRHVTFFSAIFAHSYNRLYNLIYSYSWGDIGSTTSVWNSTSQFGPAHKAIYHEGHFFHAIWNNQGVVPTPGGGGPWHEVRQDRMWLANNVYYRGQIVLYNNQFWVNNVGGWNTNPGPNWAPWTIILQYNSNTSYSIGTFVFTGTLENPIFFRAMRNGLLPSPCLNTLNEGNWQKYDPSWIGNSGSQQVTIHYVEGNWHEHGTIVVGGTTPSFRYLFYRFIGPGIGNQPLFIGPGNFNINTTYWEPIYKSGVS